MNANGDYGQLVQRLTKLIDEEYAAIHCYEKMAKKAPTEKKKKQILSIREDEIKHYEQLVNIYSTLTGSYPTPKIKKECPEDFGRALAFAFENEQQAVQEYLTLGDLNIHSSIRRIFRRAALDEQNHAVWFLSYLYANGLKNNIIFGDQWHMK